MKRLTIQVSPRSSQNKIVGTNEAGILKIKLTAPPVDGAANKMLITLLSKEFEVAKSKIKILKGETSKMKIVEIGD